MINFETVKIQWVGDPVDEAGLREDMAFWYYGMEEPEDLVCHSYFTENTLDGPSVFVYGEGNYFVAQYFEESEWVSLEEWEEDDKNA